jgi:hypothetical protein
MFAQDAFGEVDLRRICTSLKSNKLSIGLHQRRYPISATSFLLNLDLADPAPDGMFSLAFRRGYDG